MCVCVCVCVIVVTIRRWADVGLWVAVWVFAKISFRRPMTTFARLTQSQAISKSIPFSSLSDRWKIRTSFTFFHFFGTPFSYNNRFLYHGDPAGESAGGRRSTSKSTCGVPAWTLTSENASFGVCASEWSHQTDLWPQDLQMFTFFGSACDCRVWNFAIVPVPTFIIGGLWGSTATNALVKLSTLYGHTSFHTNLPLARVLP